MDTVVLVTGTEYRKAEKVFVDAARRGLDCRPAPDDEDGLAGAIAREKARCVIVGVNRYAGALYDALPEGGLIVRFGVGHDGIDKTRAAARRILCANTPGVLDASVAECAIGLMLCAARRFDLLAGRTRAGHWSPPAVGGVELSGKRLAVIGCGRIGRRVAAAARAGFAMPVNGFDLSPPEGGDFDRSVDDWTSAVADADFVSLHLPGIPETRNFVDAPRLAAMRSGAWLINTARGSLVDEDALFDAISSGRLAGAALDVCRDEPYRPANPDKDLRCLENVIITPHIGSHTEAACLRMAEASLRNVEFFSRGEIAMMTLAR